MFSPSDGAAILFPAESYAVAMAFALALGTVLAIVGLLITSVQGFAVASGLHGAAVGPLAKFLVTRHVAFAIPAVLFSLFSQSMVIFYFIGTGRLVKDETARYPEKERRRIVAALSDLKRRTSPPATFALLSSIAVFVLGGAVHTRALPSWTHLAASVTALAIHCWALVAEWKAFGDNARLMADPRRFARENAERPTSPRRSSSGPR
jgi:hypothetical protein